MDALAIIPARGGSKRIPGKNTKLFAGRPVIAYSIEAAKASGCFSRIIVSTDSEHIAEVARHYGAETPFMRPAALADDHTATAPVLIHALQALQAEYPLPGQFCCIYPAAPFITPEDLARGRALLIEHAVTSVFPVTTFPSSIYRALGIQGGFVRILRPENLETRTQDLPEAYHDAGQFYWCDTGKFLAEHKLWTDRSMPLVLPRHRVCDLDTEEDWRTGELLFAAINIPTKE